MRDHRDFADFYEASLQYFYEAGAAIRLSSGIKTFRYLCMSLVVIALLGFWGKAPKWALFPVAGVAVYWLATTPYLQNRKYKVSLLQVHQEAINELIWVHERDWRYTLRSPRMKREVRDSGLFPRNIDFVHEKGCIAGPVGMCLMAAVRVELGNYFEVHQKVGNLSRKVRRHRSTFSGFLVSTDFPRPFYGTVTLLREGPSNVKLNNPEFESVFKVHASDPIAAESILNSKMISQIMSLANHFAEIPFTLTFKDSVLYIALPWEQEFFSPAFDDNARWQAAYSDSKAIETISDMTKVLLAEQDIFGKRRSA